VVAPATFNTLNKIANGITDTLAVGLLCEVLGYGRPVVVVPWFNRGLARHGAYERSLGQLGADGVRVILTPRTQPGAELPDRHEDFPWDALFDDVARCWPA
jgi:phosphopantothenoylcysteine synthetase/decarboxylase